MRFLAAENIFLERLGNIKETKEKRKKKKETKITRKHMKEIDAFEAKIIGIKELMIGTIASDCNRLLTNLGFKEKSVVDRMKLIKTKLKRASVTRKNC